jgi:hypothetical protein
MARPQPKVLLEYTDRKTNKTDQILETSGIWAVFYLDNPINFKNDSSSSEPKYKRFCFANSGHAINLAKKLNSQFKCKDFSVYKLSGGTKIF